eukprot:5960834-Heterocapsa_arctica.AAC.1
MVMARMPEDRSKTFRNLQTPSKTFKAMYTCMCTPVGPTDDYSKYRMSRVRAARPSPENLALPGARVARVGL